jgi:hypothetical protein
VMENLYGNAFMDHHLSGTEIASLALKIWNELNMDELEKFHPRSFKEFGLGHDNDLRIRCPSTSHRPCNVENHCRRSILWSK